LKKSSLFVFFQKNSPLKDIIFKNRKVA